MKKKDFPLIGILKVREYKEQLALQEYAKETRKDRLLASEYEELEYGIQNSMNKIVDMDSKKSFEMSRYIYDYVSASRERKVAIHKLRMDMKPQVEKARNQYNKVRLELESIKILEELYNTQQKKEIQKYNFNEIQERILCQKQFYK